MTMTPEQMGQWIANSMDSVKTDVAFGRLRVTVANSFARECAARLSRVKKELFDVSSIRICIYDAPFRQVGAWARNPAVDGFPAVMAVLTNVGEILRNELVA